MKYRELYIISHADRGSNFRGPTDVIVDNLQEMNVPFFLIEHDLCGKEDTFIFYFANDGTKSIAKTISRSSKNKFIRYIEEYRLNKKIAKDFFKEDGILICVNPLNALAGVSIKKQKKIYKTIFISADYTKNRFGNFLLNYLYCWIDKYASLNTDITGSVSTRIQSMRKKIGLPDQRNLFFPNTPPENLLNHFKSEHKAEHSLVSVGSLSNQLSYYTMFEAIEILRKKYPDITLRIIGGGEKEKEYKEYIIKQGLEGNVIFLGRMEHVNVLKTVSQSQIGLALYSGEWDFNYYGDSMKIREYVGLGLPVITTDTHSTVDDIKNYQCGFVITDNKDTLVEQIEFLFIQENYEAYSANALKMSKKYSRVYKNFLESVLFYPEVNSVL